MVAGCDSNRFTGRFTWRFTGRPALVEVAAAEGRFGLAFEAELICFETLEETDEETGEETDGELNENPGEELAVDILVAGLSLLGSSDSWLAILVIS